MRIVVIGGAGRMGRVSVYDLSESPEVKEILIADYSEERAKEYAASFKDSRIKGSFVDAHNIDETANLIKGYDAVINAGQLDINISVMKACLEARCRHYNDLGGMFVMTRKQLELFDDFKRAGLTAVIGVGVSVGITNVMARYGYDRLDEVEEVHIANGARDMTDTKGIDVFRPPFAIRQVIKEFVIEPVAFVNGQYKGLPFGYGEEEITFPEPIGRLTCRLSIHGELGTIPDSFKDKGVKEVTYRISMPPEVEETCKALARVGFGSEEPIMVRGGQVVPMEVLAAVVDRQLKEKLEGVELKVNAAKCLRVQVIGKKNRKKIEYIIYSIIRPHSRWGLDYATGIPSSIVAQMQVKGMITEPGVWGPEQVVDPEYFFKELAKREIHIKSEIKEDVT